ncbi:recombinase family protein [Neobacillus sp. 179-C4.2 HS]|uniref:Recombinase family protein n=1 Tax=Neobacillus driksii TaxID=3035913 RepID=A0ABV4YV87_9BACI|nr:recombinase family protein [Neobacillus sp. 179.-C4.2 HS]MDP5192749.1 recombinase family protein [Neobacillus sp. 179.-C4.2 HS]
MASKITINDMKTIAKERGGRCLSENYINKDTPLIWECEKGHIWEATPNRIKYHNSWCQECKAKYTIEDMHKIAVSRGGKCLSNTYINNRTNLKWECNKCGRQWEAKPSHIMGSKNKEGSWCPSCSKKRNSKYTIGAMRNLALQRNGKCLSDFVESSTSKLKWECEKGHQWIATISQVIGTKNKKGSWCPHCAVDKRSQTIKTSKRLQKVKELKILAKSMGGKCLSEEFIGPYKTMIWQCKEGHTWEKSASAIEKGQWCPFCKVNEYKKKVLQEMNQIAHARGGRCLSEEFLNSRTNLMWECSLGHVFELDVAGIKLRHSWCPQCSSFNKSEERCRYIFESLLGKKFYKTRSILKGYELDGYNKELSLAFEHQGRQHYEYVERFFSSVEEFNELQKRDKEKRDLCKEKKISLIEIPYYESNNNDKQLISFIEKQILEILGNVNLNTDFGMADFYNWYYNKSAQGGEFLDDLRVIAELREGKLISQFFVDSNTPLAWECIEGHIWEARSNDIKRGGWCPICSNTAKLEFAEIAKRLEARGFKVISRQEDFDVFNTHTKFRLECQQGHQWEALPTNIFNGHGCFECSYIDRFEKVRENEEKRFQNFIAQKGGKVLSKYQKDRIKISIECGFGHLMIMTPQAFRRGGWCSICKPLDDTENLFVSKIFNLWKVEKGFQQIANRLIKEGIKTKKGGKWSASTVKSILNNERYQHHAKIMGIN